MTAVACAAATEGDWCHSISLAVFVSITQLVYQGSADISWPDCVIFIAVDILAAHTSAVFCDSTKPYHLNRVTQHQTLERVRCSMVTITVLVVVWAVLNFLAPTE